MTEEELKLDHEATFIMLLPTSTEVQRLYKLIRQQLWNINYTLQMKRQAEEKAVDLTYAQGRLDGEVLALERLLRVLQNMPFWTSKELDQLKHIRRVMCAERDFTMTEFLKLMNFKLPKQPVHNAKDERNAELARKYREGVPVKELSVEYGISKTAINVILRRLVPKR